jgi:hypothetical protein
MRGLSLVIVLLAVLTAPAFAQKAEIESVNAKWMELFEGCIVCSTINSLVSRQ